MEQRDMSEDQAQGWREGRADTGSSPEVLGPGPQGPRAASGAAVTGRVGP